jgi:hypothetical protein
MRQLSRYRSSVLGPARPFFNPLLMLAGYTVVFEAREGGDESKANFACRALCREDHPRAVRRIRQPGARPPSPTSLKEGEVPDWPRFDNAISFSRHARQSAARPRGLAS